jgi:hypothetical protein
MTAGGRLGRYEILSLIGSGGMGELDRALKPIWIVKLRSSRCQNQSRSTVSEGVH